MWDLVHPWWEYVIRSLIIYSVVYLLLRVVGKKQIGEMSPFDLVLLLIISESVSSAITGGDDSVGAGIIAVSTFVIANYLLDVAIFRFRVFELLMEGRPRVIVKEGLVDRRVCAKELITEEEIESSLREHGIDSLQKVRLAVLETNGKINVLKNE